VWFLIAKDEGHGYRKKPNQDFSVLRDGRVLAGVSAEIKRERARGPKTAPTAWSASVVRVASSRFTEQRVRELPSNYGGPDFLVRPCVFTPGISRT